MKKFEDIHVISIAGSGVMGASMAQIFAKFDYDVVLYDKFPASLDNARELIAANQKAAVEAGDITAEKSESLVGKIGLTDDINELAKGDIIIEAIIERLDIKQSFWSEVSRLVSADTILATNTSGLSITEIAKAIEGPERFAGMHWINPPHIIPLIEIIKGDLTADETTQTIEALSKAVGKVPVTVDRDVPGFILNRLQFCLLREAMHIVEEGIGSIEDVDNVMKYGLGMRYACLGPFQVSDFGGLDTFHNISSYLFAELCDAKEPQKLLKDLVEDGAYGIKAHKGFYDYADGKHLDAIDQRDKMFLALSSLLYQ